MTITGIPQLRSRFEAITPTPKLMRDLALHAVREQKLLAPRKTGNLGRSIGIGRVTATYAETVASAEYAAFVELGTRPHVIVPRTKKVLRWPATGSATLSGRVASGGQAIFARKVNHPGTKAQPFMVPGARKAVENIGAEAIVKQWNDAA
jgi:hypothetical protein